MLTPQLSMHAQPEFGRVTIFTIADRMVVATLRTDQYGLKHWTVQHDGEHVDLANEEQVFAYLLGICTSELSTSLSGIIGSVAREGWAEA